MRRTAENRSPRLQILPDSNRIDYCLDRARDAGVSEHEHELPGLVRDEVTVPLPGFIACEVQPNAASQLACIAHGSLGSISTGLPPAAGCPKYPRQLTF